MTSHLQDSVDVVGNRLNEMEQHQLNLGDERS